MCRRHFSVLFLAGASLVVACSEPPPPAEPVIRPVRVIEVYATGGVRTRAFSGVARAGVESTLSFRVAGAIDALPVRVGDRVGSGQLIARLDPVDYELQVKETEAALSQAQAQARNADADLRRVRALYENDNASRADLDAEVAGAASASAQVESVSKRLELALRQVDYTRLLAPIAGAIAAVSAEVNENVNPGEGVVVLTAGAMAPEVEVAVPEGVIRQIVQDAPVTVIFDAIPGRRFEGVVTEVGVMASATGTTFPVTVDLRDGVGDVRPGMAAEVTIELPDDGRGLRFVVPAQAVAEDRQGRFVFVAEPSGDGLAVVRRRAVSVGDFEADGLEVLDGLADGDRVVTAGVSRIQDGAEVRLTTEG
jgi:RND family efflux transporter MFP subunit